jgi:hypothetical protein
MASKPGKKPDQYLKGLEAHWKERRVLRTGKGRMPSRGTNSVNDCWKPSNEASKADLREYHAEEMKLRRRRQLARVSA